MGARKMSRIERLRNALRIEVAPARAPDNFSGDGAPARSRKPDHMRMLKDNAAVAQARERSHRS